MAGPPQPPGSPGPSWTAPEQPPVPAAPAPTPSPQPLGAWPAPAPATSTGKRAARGAAIAGAVAIVAGAGSVVATVLPVTVWGDDSQEPFTILPIATGFESLNEFSWFALEPIGIGIAAIVLGLALLVARRPATGGGGALLAFGFTTLLAFAAYAVSTILTESYGEPYGPGMGPGTLLGLTSALLLFVAGALSIGAGRGRGR